VLVLNVTYVTLSILINLDMNNRDTTSNIDKLISVKQAAEQIGFSRVHVVRLIHAGKIPARKIGRNYVIDANDLEEYWIGEPVKRVVQEYGKVLQRLNDD